MSAVINVKRPDGQTCPAYLAEPGGGGGAPAIVVIQEWWGLNDWVKSVVDRYAAQGYAAIAPDLYRGQVATDPELAHELSRGLPDARAIGDIREAAKLVKTRTEAPTRKVAVVGFCMGGRLAFVAERSDGDRLFGRVEGSFELLPKTKREVAKRENAACLFRSEGRLRGTFELDRRTGRIVALRAAATGVAFEWRPGYSPRDEDHEPWHAIGFEWIETPI